MKARKMMMLGLAVSTAALLGWFSAPVQASNLLLNPGFEDGSGFPPDNWTAQSYDGGAVNTYNMGDPSGAWQGEDFITMDADPGPGQTLVEQTVDASALPAGDYVLSAYVKNLLDTEQTATLSMFGRNSSGGKIVDVIDQTLSVPADGAWHRIYITKYLAFDGPGSYVECKLWSRPDRSFSWDAAQFEPGTTPSAWVPEPATIGLLLLGIVGLIRRR